ncbi:MAG: hypothetical protein KF819_16995 [Labilithrix sp.]|nr:hypothetical protein [Labilithrix sp.]
MRPLSLKRSAFGFALVLALLGGGGAARAGGLTASESQRLERGETVIRPQTYDADDRRYVGGITYTVLRAAPAEISAIFEDVDAYRRVLPRTKRARFVGMDGGDRLIELAQGNAIAEAEYTIRVRTDVGGREVRFWLEPSRPHDIDDAWGFFRLEPFTTEAGEPRVLLTYAALVDVGPGIVRELFEERVRSALLSVPQLLGGYVAEVRRTRAPLAAAEVRR